MRMTQSWYLPPLGLALTFSLACSADPDTLPIGGGAGVGFSGMGADMAGSGGAPPVGSAGMPAVGGVGAGGAGATLLPDETGVTRLTLRQFDNSVADLLGTTRRYGSEQEGAPKDGAAAGYEIGLTAMGPLYAEALVYAAEAASADAVINLPTLLQCDVAVTGEAACASAFIDQFGRRAFRRTLTEAEKTSLTALFTHDAGMFGFEAGIRSVVEAILLSPSFLHHIDPAVDLDGLVTPGTQVTIGGTALASRLSYLLWGSLPDEMLVTAAETGQLATREQLQAQAERLLADPRADRGFMDFAGQWLQFFKLSNPTMDKEPEHYPGFSPATKAAFKASLEAFVFDAIAADSAEQLFTSNQFYANEEMATLLGIPGVTGQNLVPVQLDPTQRFGLLTHPSLMAMLAHPAETAPFKRALFTWEQLLCLDLPPPIDNIPPPPDGLDPNLSVRDTLAARTEVDGCIGCHIRINPVAFAFEHYGPLGEYRSVDDVGAPVNAATVIAGSPGLDGPSANALELAQRFADSDAAFQCITQQYFRSLAHRKTTGAENPAIKEMAARFRAGGGSFSQLAVEIVLSPTFLTRVYQGDAQ